MPKDVPWCKHDSDASSDFNIKPLIKSYGWEGYGWYWYLIETLRTADGFRIPYNDFTFDGISEDMKCDSDKAKKFIDDCIDKFHLFRKDGDGFFYSERLRRDMNAMIERRDKQSEGGRKGSQKRWGSETESVEEPPKEVKHKYGEYKNVMLSESEYRKLNDKLGEITTAELIESMSQGIKIHGYKYKDHYLALLKWDQRDKKSGDSEGKKYKDIEAEE